MVAILLSRFFAGTFGRGIMFVATGMLAELYSPLHLGVAVAMAARMTMLGSAIAPVVESYIVEAGGWLAVDWPEHAYPMWCCGRGGRARSP